jgi:hypothetical protein
VYVCVDELFRCGCCACVVVRVCFILVTISIFTCVAWLAITKASWTVYTLRRKDSREKFNFSIWTRLRENSRLSMLKKRDRCVMLTLVAGPVQHFRLAVLAHLTHLASLYICIYTHYILDNASICIYMYACLHTYIRTCVQLYMYMPS